MKKPIVNTEKPAPTAKIKQPIATLVVKAMPNQSIPDKKTTKKTQVVASQPVRRHQK